MISLKDEYIGIWSPKISFKKKFGKTFGANEFLKYKDTLKKNDYKDCDLLCSKDITETGVYYVDYAQLNKKETTLII